MFLDDEDKLQNDNAQVEKVSGKEVSYDYPIPYKLADNCSNVYLVMISNAISIFSDWKKNLR